MKGRYHFSNRTEITKLSFGKESGVPIGQWSKYQTLESQEGENKTKQNKTSHTTLKLLSLDL